MFKNNFYNCGSKLIYELIFNVEVYYYGSRLQSKVSIYGYILRLLIKINFKGIFKGKCNIMF